MISWLFAASLVFISLGMTSLLFVDIATFLLHGKSSTLSAYIRKYLDAHGKSQLWPMLVGYIFGFVSGSLLVHFSGWYV